MKLSELAFLSVKNVNYLDDASFNYYGFCNGEFDSDIDYSNKINNVFSPLNEAITRLQDLEKIPYLVEEVEVKQDKTVDLTTISKRPKRVVGVAAVYENGNYEKLSHVAFGRNCIRINSPFSTFRTKIYIEYVENIPSFSRKDILPVGETDENIDLFEEYGIDDTMSNYIMEYVQGKLMEPLAPDLANMHVTRAEAYFNNIPTTKKNFPQQVVKSVFSIGE